MSLRNTLYRLYLCLFGVLFSCFSHTSKVEAATLSTGVLIPFYNTPTLSAIQPLLDQKALHPDVPMRVILNPASGVGSEQDQVYVDAIASLQAAGIEVVGYIYTDYNTRSIEAVQDEVDLWRSWYDPDGIFLDAMGAKYEYYMTLNQYIKDLGFAFVVGNAEQNVDPSYLQVVDTVVIANDPFLPNLDDYCNWNHTYLPKSGSAIFAHNVSDLSEAFIDQAKEFIGWIYVTEAGGMAPWETISSYLPTLMTALDLPGNPGVIIPFYIYPTAAAIQPLLDAHQSYPNVPMTVILNPNNGSGSSKNTDYANASLALRQAGISVVGYVFTNYGNRSTATVQTQISRWVNWYQVDGIFFDEMALNHTYYSSLTAYAKGLGVKYTIGNPGTNINPSAGEDVDIVIVYEDPGLADPTDYTNWLNTYNREKIGAISYNIPSLPTSYLTDASDTFGWFYITNDTLPNPYDSLPIYFQSLIQTLSTLP